MELRHTGNLKIFSENASTNESSAFGTTTNTDDINTLLNTNFQAGWENGIDEDGFPLRKWFNGKDKAITKLIAYLFQQGTPKYDATQKYYVDSICVYSGIAYISLTGTEESPNIGNTPSSSIGTSWNILNNSIPAGSIIAYAASSAPFGYLKANGSLVSRSTYSRLFSAIGTTYGAGDGSTTFALPDLRGEFVRGWDDSRGVDSSRTIGSLQSDSYLNHNHNASSVAVGDHVHTAWTDTQGAHSHGLKSRVIYPAGGANRAVDPVSGNEIVSSTEVAGAHTHNVSMSGAGAHTHTINIDNSTSGGSETRPRNIALLYCIKY